MLYLWSCKRYCFLLLISLWLACTFIIIDSYAQSDIPPGFENLEEESETTPVDVFFGKENLGSYLATFDDDRLTFDEHSALFDTIKSITIRTPISINLSCLAISFAH